MSTAFRCTVCGFVHEGVAPPTQCPVCGVGAEFFEQISDSALSPVGGQAGPGAPQEAATSAASVQDVLAPVYRVIVGGGAAAFAAAESLRECDATCPIALIHREPELPYDRMSLTRYLAGEVTRSQLPLGSAGWAEARRITLFHGEARHIDPAAQKVQLANGQELSWDRLLIATGSHAFVPPLPGSRKDGVHVLRTVADADAILASLSRPLQVICVGGGLLGLEAAGSLARRGAKVTILEEAPHLLPRQLSAAAGERLARYLQQASLTLRTGTKVLELLGDESVRGVRLADGSVLPADRVIIAAGVRANIELAKAAGLTCGRGIQVDDSLHTSHANILAAGDVAEHRGLCIGLWSVAVEQGKSAGRGLAGQDSVFSAKPPTTLLKVLDVPVMSFGRFEPQDPLDQVEEAATEHRYLRVLLNHDRVVGANLIGGISVNGRVLVEPQLVAALRRAVSEGLPLSAEPEIRSALTAAP